MAWPLHIASPTEYLSYWATQSLEAATTLSDGGPAIIGCNKFVLSFSRTIPAGAREDRATISMHIGKTAAPLFSFFTTTAECDAVWARISTWWTAVKAYTTSQYTLSDVSAYIVRKDRYMTTEAGHKADLTGPRIYFKAVGVAGTSAGGRQPDQVASTVTLKTPSRKHWGRFYIPGIAQSGNVDGTYGRFTNAFVDGITNATQALKNNLNSDGYELGVWSPTARSFLEVMELHADDVPDVVRRRRAKTVNYRKSLTA